MILVISFITLYFISGKNTTKLLENIDNSIRKAIMLTLPDMVEYVKRENINT